MKKLLFILLFPVFVNAGTYYVSTTGSDAAAGSIGAPWATWQKGFNTIIAGDILYIRGGTYTPASATVVDGLNHAVGINNHDGTLGNLITVLAYPGETPILNASLATIAGTQSGGIYFQSCDYWYIKGITVTASGGEGTYLLNSNNITQELCICHHNGESGFLIQGASENNLIYNCDSYANFNAPLGDDADGFEISFLTYKSPGSGGPRINTMRGCRSFYNSDDGVDNYRNDGMMIIDSCWIFANGYAYNTTTHLGDGNGLKLGITNADHSTEFLKIITNNLSFDNYADGIQQNNAQCKFYIYNNTSWNNGGNGLILPSYDLAHIIRNNAFWGNANNDFYGAHTNATVDHNSYDAGWQPSGPVANSSDFLSIDTTGVTGARQSNGSLPVLNFLKLSSSSDLINAGYNNVGIGYQDSDPDIGAYEFTSGDAGGIIIKRKVITH